MLRITTYNHRYHLQNALKRARTMEHELLEKTNNIYHRPDTVTTSTTQSTQHIDLIQIGSCSSFAGGGGKLQYHIVATFHAAAGPGCRAKYST